MSKNKMSVLNTVKSSSSVTTYNTCIDLSHEDYDRLVRALEREDALRRIAYDALNTWDKAEAPDADEMYDAFSAAIGRTTLDIVELKEEVRKLVAGKNYSADYVADRVARLVSRLED